MPRIGQLLSESVPLSQHDVEEILHEQKTTRQRFGDAALSLGLARPDQVWNAWLSQLRHTIIDLDRTPADPAALAAVPAELAVKSGIVPLRIRGGELVVATAEELSPATLAEIERHSGRRVIVARAHAAAIARRMIFLYPAEAASAA